MYPIVCKIGPFAVYSYGTMLVVAFLVASGLICRQAKKYNFSQDIIFNFAFVVLITGIIGARFFYIFENLKFYINNPLEIIMLNHGGLSWFGGLFFALFFGVIYLKRKRLAVYAVFDLTAPFLALAQAIGRIGCLLNGCCFGTNSSFGIYFPAHNAVLVPTQLYSSLALLFIYVFLRIIQERPHKEGYIFFLYLLLYSIKRFLIEFWRQDNPKIFWGLSLFQLISIGLFLFSGFRLIRLSKKQ